MDDLQPSDGRIDRRTALRRGLVAGGVALTVPVVTTFNIPAGAQTSGAGFSVESATYKSNGSYTYTVTGTGTSGESITLRSGNSCTTGTTLVSGVVDVNGSWTTTFTRNNLVTEGSAKQGTAPVDSTNCVPVTFTAA